jgi:lipopolysaccharide transport system permease protein
VLLPAAAALGGILDLLVGSVLLVGLMLYYRVAPGWALLLTPLFVAQTVLLVLGTGMLLASLNVRFRDVKYTIPFIIQIGLFVTPIIYPVTFVPKRYETLLALNPLTGIVEGFRACLFGGVINWQIVGISWLVTVALLALGGLHFSRTERVFADIV